MAGERKWQGEEWVERSVGGVSLLRKYRESIHVERQKRRGTGARGAQEEEKEEEEEGE